MKKNIGKDDKTIRLIIGLFLIIAAMNVVGWLRLILLLIGAVLILTGLIGFCLLYEFFGINTLKKGINKK